MLLRCQHFFLKTFRNSPHSIKPSHQCNLDSSRLLEEPKQAWRMRITEIRIQGHANQKRLWCGSRLEIKTKSKNSFLAFSFDNLGDTDTWKIKCSSTRDQTFNCSSNGTSRFQGLFEITQNRNEAFSFRINVKMLMQKQLICFYNAECAFDVFTFAFKSYCDKG